jgi:hypothetical protein
MYNVGVNTQVAEAPSWLWRSDKLPMVFGIRSDSRLKGLRDRFVIVRGVFIA